MKEPLRKRAEKMGLMPYQYQTLVSFPGAQAGYLASLRAARIAAVSAVKVMCDRSSLRRTASQIGCSPTYLSQVVNGQPCSPKFIIDLLIALENPT